MILTALNGNTITGPAEIIRELAQHMAERGITYTIEGEPVSVEQTPEDDYLDKMDDEYRASLSPEQLVGYRKFNGELVDCADCKLVNVAVTGGESHPDYVGHVDVSMLACGCQVVVSDGAEAVR